VLLVAMLPLLGVCFLSSAVDGLVALQVAGTNAAFILLLLSEGIRREPFADLALVLALMSFVGSLAFSYFLERAQ
ncbi:MAG: multicomponent Na+:H+ antiporter subunit, partial [Thermoleophilaceae bacterium]|nr:multicomponent Na+:H+ antiporter subunit [Thermoleophilaceae bacterium]